MSETLPRKTSIDFDLLSRLEDEAIEKAKDRMRKMGVAIYSRRDGEPVWELPDGTIVTEDPSPNTLADHAKMLEEKRAAEKLAAETKPAGEAEKSAE